MMQRLLSHLEHTDTLIIGGEKGCAASLVYVPLQLLAQKAHEWSKDETIYVFDGDIFKAFDSLKPSKAIIALQDLGLHPAICAAWLREFMELQCQPRLLGEHKDFCDQLPFNALRQGGPDSMKV